MTVRGRFFTRAEYQQHVFQALMDFPGEIKTLPPAILFPTKLWSGKQIISTIVLNLVPKVSFLFLDSRTLNPTSHNNEVLSNHVNQSFIQN
jgi:hypothetical protein